MKKINIDTNILRGSAPWMFNDARLFWKFKPSTNVNRFRQGTTHLYNKLLENRFHTLLAHTGTESVLEIIQIKRFSRVYNGCFSIQYNKIKYNGSLLLHLIPTHIKALYSYLLYSNYNLNNVLKHHQNHWCFSSINKHPEFL